MKRVTSTCIMILVYIFAFCSSATTVEAMQLYYNGKYVVLKDSSPMIVREGRSFIPLRAITELIGYDIDWNPITKEIIINEDEVFLKLQMSSNLYYLNDVINEFDVEPFIWNNRSYVPIRLLEALGLSVEYNREYNTVILEKNEPESNSLFNENGIQILFSSARTVESDVILEFEILNNSPNTLEIGEVVLGIYSDSQTSFYRINDNSIPTGTHRFFKKQLSSDQFNIDEQLYIEILISSVNQVNFTEIMGWPPTIINDLP